MMQSVSMLPSALTLWGRQCRVTGDDSAGLLGTLLGVQLFVDCFRITLRGSY